MAEKEILMRVAETNVGTKTLQRIEVPAYITDNLAYPLFDWQRKALQYFLAYEDEDNDLVTDGNAPTHLMFNMATGTGKTLLMAGLMLYYYKKGYRHFLFFVNQNNIVGKTEENLLNSGHSKYLFKQNVVIDDKTVRIKKVETFSRGGDDMEVLFTSIHKLHNSIYAQRENAVVLEELQKKNIVMLGDEAHHLNADTKKKKGEQGELDLTTTELNEKASDEIIEKSWEDTVIRKILHKGVYPNAVQNGNVLLEFTATVPRDAAVKEKYADKTIFSFDLKEFLKAGYTKEINLVASGFNKQQRVLQALLFNWYRYKVAMDKGLPNFKPVILFRSKLIEDSKRDFEWFKELIKNLSVKDFDFLKDIKDEESSEGAEIYLKGKSRIIDIKHCLQDGEADWQQVISYLQYNFAERNCIITNSKTGTKTIEKTTDEQNRLLNSLEDKSNPITAIFTVQRLTEGWDVLNLFDIVRLYKGQNEGGSNTKTSVATTSEVQLIGRGVRYYPFKYEDRPERKRKFDGELQHELRVLEEFYYHSDDEHRYLSELKNELKQKGYIDDKRKVKTFDLKEDFKTSSFFKKGRIFGNDQKDNPNARKPRLDDADFVKNFGTVPYEIPSIKLSEEEIELDKEVDKQRYITKEEARRTLNLKLKDFYKESPHVVRKAVNIKAKKDLSVLRFCNLKNEVAIESVDELFGSKFLGEMEISVVAPKDYKSIDDIPNHIQLHILLWVFDKIEKYLKSTSNPYSGSGFTPRKFSDVFGEPKVKAVEVDDNAMKLEKQLVDNKWYVLNAFNGTSEEQNLVYFLQDTMGNLQEKHEQVFLLRNEEVYTIYDFETGKGFQPDFLLFLKEKTKDLYYQVFIEPKGDQFKDKADGFEASKEGWKQTFMDDIYNRYGKNDTLNYENDKYKLVGLPLYNEKKKEDFRRDYFERLGLA